MLVESTTVIDLQNATMDPVRKDYILRFDIAGGYSGPLQVSIEVCGEGITGPPGGACMVFFNIEYVHGPVFWDAFLYPDTGSTPWRTLSCDVRCRGEIRAVEMHIRFHAKGRLLLRNLGVVAIEPWPDDAECVVAMFGDSTDMTNYLPTALRLGQRLEWLLRDRFPDRRVDIHCLAEGGEYLWRLLESGRLERELQALPRCDIAMIRYGLNDRSQKVAPADFKRQLHAACATIRERFPAVRIVLSTTIPPHSAEYDAQTAAVAEELNLPLIRLDTFMRERSAAGDGDWHFQAGSRIGRHRDRNPPDNPDGLAGDTHPNAYGAQMIAELYFDQLVHLVAERLVKSQEGGHVPAHPGK